MEEMTPITIRISKKRIFRQPDFPGMNGCNPYIRNTKPQLNRMTSASQSFRVNHMIINTNIMKVVETPIPASIRSLNDHLTLRILSVFLYPSAKYSGISSAYTGPNLQPHPVSLFTS